MSIFNPFRLPNECTVFQCEVFAISKAAEILLSLEITGKKIAICTDSQAALNATSSSVIKSKLVRECLCRLNELGTSNSVTLVWVPGHSDVYGNEIADILAKQGSDCHFSWAAKVPLPVCFGKEYLFSKMNENCKKRWFSIDSCVVARKV